MIRFIYIYFFCFFLIVTNSNSFAESKPDCSQYSTKTIVGVIDKMNCKRGTKVKDRKKIKKFGDLNPFKPKDKSGKIVEKKKKVCGEHSTKNLVGLMRKLRCDYGKKN